MTYFVTIFLMWSVGRLRPSWLAGCKPGVPLVAGPPYIYYTDSICTNDRYVCVLRVAQPTYALVFSEISVVVEK